MAEHKDRSPAARDAPDVGALRVALEVGRVRWALWYAVPLAAGAALLAFAFGGVAPPAVVAAAVGALAVVAGWKSRACLWGCVAGVCLGLLPFFAMRVVAVVTTTDCYSICGLGGLFAGVCIAFAVRKSRFAFDVVIGACAGAALHAAVGCAHLGLFEGLGLVAGVVVGALPLAFSRARA